MDKDRINVDVTHEEDEASADNDDESSPNLMDVTTDVERTLADKVADRQADFGDRWVTAPMPADWPTYKDAPGSDPLPAPGYGPDAHGGMTLLQDASIADLLAALRAKGQNVIALPPGDDARKAVLDDIIVDMRRLAEKFDAQAEKMTKTQMQASVTRIAFAVADVAEVVKVRI